MRPWQSEVAGYLADCAAAPKLDPRYHPTADGAVKLIWHRASKTDADLIRAEFGRQAGQ